MDNLTHTLTGLMLSRAGLNRFHPRASLILMLAANVPDCDVISLAGGPGNYLQYHRWMTHSIAALPIVALIPVLAARVFTRNQPFRWAFAWLLSVAGVASHLLLDFTNPYGIRLFLPFSDSWPVLSITSVVDIWIWLFLLLATAAPAISGLVSSEIGARPGRNRGWAVAALLFVLFYDLGRGVAHARAVALQANRIYNGETPRRSLAYPQSMNPLAWRGIVETGSFFLVQDLNLATDPGMSDPKIFYKAENSPAIEAAARTPLFQTFMKFSRALHWTSVPANEPAGATRIDASDLFFGFTATAIVDRANQVLSTRFSF